MARSLDVWTYPDVVQPSLVHHIVQRPEDLLVVDAGIRLQQRLDAVTMAPDSDR